MILKLLLLKYHLKKIHVLAYSLFFTYKEREKKNRKRVNDELMQIIVTFILNKQIFAFFTGHVFPNDPLFKQPTGWDPQCFRQHAPLRARSGFESNETCIIVKFNFAPD